MKPERRQSHLDWTAIRLDIQKISTRQEDYIKQIDTCIKATGTNTTNVGKLQTKMSFIVYIGSGAFILGIGALTKNYIVQIINYFKIHPPAA